MRWLTFSANALFSGTHTMNATALSAQDELLIGFAQFGIAQEEEPRVLLRQRARLAQEMHIDLFEQAIALFAIAMLAAGHEILPRALPTTRTRDNVIKRQFATALTTILASLVVAEQDIGSCRLQCDAWHTYIGQQLHNHRALQLKSASRDTFFDQLTNALIYKGHFLLGEQYDETALWNDRERL